MKILFLSQYFPPEICAPAARVSELCRYWAEKGEEITVITAFPNHPTGVIPDEYRGKKFMREKVDRFDLLRSWIYPAPNREFFKRLVCFFSFLLSSIYTAIFKAGKCDVVIATSPQIFVGLSGWIVSVFKKAPYVLEIRDLWPESAIELGVLKNRYLIALSRSLERFLYKHADLLVAVSKSIRDAIVQSGIPANRVILLPNGINPELFKPGERINRKRAQIQMKDQFIISYIGTHGMAHGLEVVVDAARILKEDPRFHFLFIGEGAEKKKVIAYSQKLKLENVTFLPSQPKSEIPEWYVASDVCMVVLKDLPVFETVLPSKMFEIMACQRPTLMVARGECAEMVRDSRSGVVVPPGDPARLAEAIRELADNEPGRVEMAQNGREYVLKYYDRRELAGRYLDHLYRLAGKTGKTG
ncbi:MAG: glycosyltransferase family 4 protein [Candidatus Omnitrophica bacterium]|nr:glycosyltransferase family 4 protein [Candidatus Omnitrophota bacterium]